MAMGLSLVFMIPVKVCFHIFHSCSHILLILLILPCYTQYIECTYTIFMCHKYCMYKIISQCMKYIFLWHVSLIYFDSIWTILAYLFVWRGSWEVLYCRCQWVSWEPRHLLKWSVYQHRWIFSMWMSNGLQPWLYWSAMCGWVLAPHYTIRNCYLISHTQTIQKRSLSYPGWWWD
jgi:hypothetical protein